LTFVREKIIPLIMGLSNC